LQSEKILLGFSITESSVPVGIYIEGTQENAALLILAR
jgi:hypothetical protein